MVVQAAFVGRRDELCSLDAIWRTQPASGQVVLVSADAGYGKTALIDEFVRRVGVDADVHRASPLQVEVDTSWSTLRMLTGTMTELPPAVAVAVGLVPATAGPPSLADVAFAWAESARALAAGRPTVFVIDDVQWIDRASAAAVATAMRSTPATWVLGSRTDHDSHLDVHRVADADRVTQISLPPMRRADIGELIAQHLGGRWPVPTIAYLAETSHGQPLHAIELARELRGVGGQPVPPPRGRPLSAVYGDRLDALPADAREVAALAALAVHPTIALLDALRPEVDLDTVLDVLERTGMIRVGFDSVDFTHALARRAVTERLGTVERARLHGELAARVDDPERRAVHLGEATTRPDEGVAAELEAAARTAFARGARFDAGRLSERAAQLTPRSLTAASAVRTALAGVAYVDAGDYDRARQLLDEVLHVHRDELDDDLSFEVAMAWAAVVSRREGNDAAAQAVAQQLDHVRGARPRGELLRTLVRLRQFDDLRAAERAADAAVADGASHGDPAVLLAAEAALANVRFVRGEHVDVDDLLARLDQVGDPRLGGQGATTFIQEIAAWDDRFDDARRLCEVLAEYGRTTGKVTALLNAMDQQASFELHAGNVAVARKLVDETLDILAPPRGVAMFDASEDVISLAALAGDTEEAARLIVEIAAELDATAPIMRLCFWGVAGLAEITAGRYEAAVAHLEAAWDLAGRIGFADVRSLGFQSDYAEALVHVGSLDRAAEIVAFLELAAERSRSPFVRAESLRCRGLLAGAQGLAAEAVQSLEAAVALSGSVGRPLSVGRARLALGTALRRNGARAVAREHLAAARRAFELLESPPWIARVDQEIERLGTRTGSAGALSPTEHRIATLVSQGRSNREIATEMIVSLRTVESNLTRAYRKLGVRGRTELAARGAELLSMDGRDGA